MTHESFMRRALELAERGRFTVSPNPMVGCVIVRDGRILGEGFHFAAGRPHAEVEALRACRDSPAGADLYVTLEPCAHHGRTPPCADALVAAGIARVWIATRDPHPDVDGRGIAKLVEHGIEVSVGLLEDHALRQNERFLWNARMRKPFLLIKAGMTLDGKLATSTRQSRWITSTEARETSLALREEFDAILVGSGTIREDDPSLTRRLGWNGGTTRWTRMVVDTSGELAPTARVFSDGEPTLLFTSRPETAPRGAAVEVIELPATERRLDLERVLDLAWRRGIHSVIAEGGSLLHSDLIRRRLWQKLVVFVAPMVVGGTDAPAIFGGEGARELTEAWRFRFDRAEPVGPDLMIVAYPEERERPR